MSHILFDDHQDALVVFEIDFSSSASGGVIDEVIANAWGTAMLYYNLVIFDDRNDAAEFADLFGEQILHRYDRKRPIKKSKVFREPRPDLTRDLDRIVRFPADWTVMDTIKRSAVDLWLETNATHRYRRVVNLIGFECEADAILFQLAFDANVFVGSV
jgi:hypothetical protein